MKLTLGQAAKECGKSKGTLSKALKDGRLSYIEKTKAGYQIDPAELFRVFPKKNETPFGVNDMNDQKPQKTNSVDIDLAVRLGKVEAEKSALEDQIELLREIAEQAKANATKAEFNADEWRKQAQTLALTDERSKQVRGFLGLFKKSA